MPFLHDFIGQTLTWKRPRFFSTTYRLGAGDEILATISRAGITRAKASAEEQQWTFQREGQRKLLVYLEEPRASNEPLQPLASIQLSWNWNGTLTFYDGRIYTWTRSGNWHPTWSWRDREDKTLLTLKKGHLLEIASAASDLPDLALLVLFGFYLILIMGEEDAITTAASIAPPS